MGRPWMVLLALGLLAGSVASARAGQMFKVRCAVCRLSTSLALGGGRSFDQATGWCAPCGAFRSVSWKRGTPPPRTRAGSLPCPRGAHRFAVLSDAAAVRRCPRCGRRGVRVTPWLLYD